MKKIKANRIKIFYLDHSTDFSGGQKSLLALLTALDRKQFDPVVVIDKKATIMLGELSKINVSTIRINYFNGRLQSVLLPLLFFKLLFLITGRHRVLIHSNTFKTGVIGAILGKVTKAKTIFRSRLGIVVNNHGAVDKIIYTLTDQILANSEYVASTYQQRFGEAKNVKVIYNPIFEDYSLDQAVVKKLESKFFKERGIFYFGLIGRIEPFKRQMEVVEAARILTEKFKNFKIIFFGVPAKGYGEVYHSEVIKRIKTYKLENFFEFAGFVLEINEATSLLNAVILCTEGEPLSRGVFESQLLSVPVIASASGGNIELIQHLETGLLYELNNPQDLASKMAMLMTSDELRDQIIKRAKLFVQKRFDQENTVKEEQRFYLELFAN